MELYFLGTNAGVPTLQRNVTSIGLRMLDERRALWLFDCGEGTQHQILSSPLKLSKLEKIFITHLHGDHVFGLPGLLSSRAYQGGTTPLTVYGPPGTERMIATTMEISQSRLNYDLNIVEHTGGVLFEDDSFIVESALLEHRIDSYGYRVTEKDRPGSLDSAKLAACGLKPGPLFGRLKRGETITLDSGDTVRPEDVLGAPKRGMVITILGDTRPCENVKPLAQDADVLVHEATFMHDLADTAHEYYHSTSRQAAEAALAANVGELIMTHFSSRYKDEEQLQPLLDEAKSIFPNTRLANEHQLIPVVHGKHDSSQ
ncbi:ribonuclease Z [Paenibacillus polysaccharolyticus]|uniref:ribonuclease Z n=1 Tax=Paenibacillus polysaccharolyticus TaxID=582692 RepID=UPI00209E3C4D|nr:ribonuclease Z [Paenibacillus polysaccharolyticus]MCP1133427.1 ribonuclease Z [Paenibacillus polysaccharolyticus]